MKVSGFFSFAKNMSKGIDKNLSKILSVKYSQKILDHTEQSVKDVLKASPTRAI